MDYSKVLRCFRRTAVGIKVYLGHAAQYGFWNSSSSGTHRSNPLLFFTTSRTWNWDLQTYKRDVGSYLGKKLVSRFQETKQVLHGDTQKSATSLFLWELRKERLVICSQVCRFIQNPDIRMTEECMVKRKLIEEFSCLNNKIWWNKNARFHPVKYRVNKFARIAYKLQEIEKPTYLVRELSRFGKLENRSWEANFTCRLTDQWKTSVWSAEVCIKSPEHRTLGKEIFGR